MIVRLALVMVGLAVASGAHAQPRNVGFLVHNLFLPESYIGAPVSFGGYPTAPGERALGHEHTPMFYEARVAPHLFLYSSVQDLLFKEGPAWSLSFTPDLVLRQRSAGSFPVSSPSFRPTITGQVFVQLAGTSRGGKQRLQLLVPQALFGHYSNGSSADGLSAGNFSTNRVGLGFGYRAMWFGDGARPWQAMELAVAQDVWLSPGTEPAVRNSYGVARTTLTGAYEWNHYGGLNERTRLQRQFRIRGALELALLEGAGARVTKWSSSATFAMTFRNALGIGYFFRLVDGHDYYNIRYRYRFDALFVGVIWEGGVLEYPQNAR